jgi:hypothetical protein
MVTALKLIGKNLNNLVANNMLIKLAASEISLMV